MSTDLTLLRRYHEHTDAFAFRAVVEAHAGMVFATARRVTRDAALAEDVAQETFLELARNASAITDSVGAWLHRVARRRACNAVRDAGTRRRYEEEATVVALESDRPEPTWAELEPLIDEVMDGLPDRVREPLVEHFLEGRTQQEVAARLGVSQSTVSRLLDTGIAELRAGLRRKDVMAGASLALVLAANAAVTPPAALVASLGKLAVAGVSAGAAAKPVAVAGTTAWIWRAVVITFAVAVGATWFVWRPPTHRHEAAPGAPLGNTTKTEIPAPTSPPGEPGSARDWIGRAFCPMCALEHTDGRRPEYGVFLHEEAGKTVVYDLKAAQAVKDFHERFCVPSMTDKTAVHVHGSLELLNGRQTLALGTMTRATQ
jgi:RNA polymerase sigma factor (sigma-70 family)